MIVVRWGCFGAPVIVAVMAGVPVTAAAPDGGGTVGTRVIVVGIAVTIPGFSGTYAPQIPVK